MAWVIRSARSCTSNGLPSSAYRAEDNFYPVGTYRCPLFGIVPPISPRPSRFLSLPSSYYGSRTVFKLHVEPGLSSVFER